MLLALAAWPAGAPRAAAPAAGGRRVALALLAGSAQPVAALADYQWDVRPHAAWGAQVLAGTGALATGVRAWRSGTTQHLGLDGVADPAVLASSVELLARVRVARWRALEWLATGSGGRMALTYRPDRVTVATGGAPVEVALQAQHEWVLGAGVALAGPIAAGWTWGLETERRRFALDTAHRSGGTVVLARETFGDWSVRVAFARGWAW